MSERRSSRSSEVVLVAVSLALGALCAAAYGAWKAVSAEDATSADRWAAFTDALLFPGALIMVAVAAMVWLGWKANID